MVVLNERGMRRWQVVNYYVFLSKTYMYILTSAKSLVSKSMVDATEKLWEATHTVIIVVERPSLLTIKASF